MSLIPGKKPPPFIIHRQTPSRRLGLDVVRPGTGMGIRVVSRVVPVQEPMVAGSADDVTGHDPGRGPEEGLDGRREPLLQQR